MSSSERRICLLVLGMHRSGTSALTRVLSLLGAGLPRNLLQAGEGNEAGHWEPEHLFRLHDRMLEEGGSRWDDWRKFDIASLEPERLHHYREAIKELLLTEYGDASLFVVKEPRICRFIPLYEDVLDQLDLEIRHVVPHRNPLAVIASHERRDGMTPGFVSLLWLRHVLDAEYATRGRPRVLISYEALLDDWQKEAKRIGTALSLDWPRRLQDAATDVEGHLSRDLQNHTPTYADLLERADVIEWVKVTYQALLKLTEEDGNAEALATLDRVRTDFDAGAATMGWAVFPEIAVREQRLLNARNELAAVCEQRGREIEHLKAESGAKDVRIKELTQKLNERQKEQASSASPTEPADGDAEETIPEGSQGT